MLRAPSARVVGLAFIIRPRKQPCPASPLPFPPARSDDPRHPGGQPPGGYGQAASPISHYGCLPHEALYTGYFLDLSTARQYMVGRGRAREEALGPHKGSSKAAHTKAGGA